MSAVRFLAALTLAAAASAEDWPEYRGQARTGEWKESGVLERFPPEGLRVTWRAPVHSGFSGPAVAGGRVFVADFQPTNRPRGVERALAFEESTGRRLWSREWPADYTGLADTYATGPRTTPTVDGDRVYFFGAMGMLLCLRISDGTVVWQHDLVREYGTEVPVWGMAASPLVDGARLFVLAGAAGDGKVMAFDKFTGRVLWRALPSGSEPGYSSPILIQAGGKPQLIQWHSQGVASLDPASGRVFWELPFSVQMGSAVAAPVWSGRRLMITSFFDGPMMMELDGAKPAARLLWRGQSKSETRPDGLHGLIATPAIDGDYVYGICAYGQLRCLNASTGKQVWETADVIGERARWAAAHLVRHEGRYFINNDRGELILARLSPAGYDEIGRTRLIEPTTDPGNRRAAKLVNWTHPAYANRHIVTRNDRELIRASLER